VKNVYAILVCFGYHKRRHMSYKNLLLYVEWFFIGDLEGEISKQLK